MGGRCLWPSVSLWSAFCNSFASFRLGLAFTDSSFPGVKKGYCCPGQQLCTFSPSGSRGAKIAHLKHSFVTHFPAADPGIESEAWVLVFSNCWHTSVSTPYFFSQKLVRVKMRKKDIRQICPIEIFPSLSFHSLVLKIQDRVVVVALSEFSGADDCSNIFLPAGK